MKSIHIANVCLVAAVAVALSSPAHADSTVMTDNAGMSVYTFDKDSAEMSACYADCASAWPPVPVDTMPTGADFSTMSRDDGTEQAVYHGQPLYLFAGDKKSGDINGDNVQNLWHAVRNSNASSAPQSKPAPSLYGSSYGY
jgi:predicted lipoprotein with Yx(FWY)xxD motif